MEGKKKSRGIGWFFSGPMALAALMFSTYVGPGFASGTQTTSYFMNKGWIGVFLAPAVVGLLTFLWCFLVNEFDRIYRPRNFREQSDMIYKNPVVREILGIFTDVVGIFQILLVCSAMISGAANLFNSTWGIPMAAGTILFAAAILILTLWGTQLVLKAGTFFTICILAVTIYIAVIGILPAWPAAQAWMQQRVQPEEFGFSKLYAWYVIVTFTGTYCSGRNAAVPASLEALQTRMDSFVAALGNALLCTLSTCVYTVIFAAGMPGIINESIPTLYALEEIVGASSVAQILYVIIALAAMLSTGVSLMYGGIARYSGPVKKIWKTTNDVAVNAVIVIVSIVLCTLLSTVGILTIIGVGYTYMGVISTPVIFFLWFITIPYRMMKDRKEGKLPKTPDASSL